MVDQKSLRKRLWLLLAFLGLTLWTRAPAYAKSPSTARARIVIVMPRAGTPLAIRLRAELATIGFEMVEVEAPTDGTTRETLESAARDANARAAMSVMPTQSGVEISVVDPGQRDKVLRDVVERTSRKPFDNAIIAARAVEVLRANFLEPEAPKPPKEKPEPAPSPEPTPVPPPESFQPKPSQRLFSAELAPAIGVSTGGMDATFQALAATRMRLGPVIELSLLGIVPLSSSSLVTDKGSVLMNHYGAGLGIRLGLPQQESRWQPSGEAGLSLMWLQIEGQPRPSYEGRQETLTTVAPFARVGIAYTVASWLRVRADILGAAALGRPVIRVDGEEKATWGRPALLGSLGVETR